MNYEGQLNCDTNVSILDELNATIKKLDAISADYLSNDALLEIEKILPWALIDEPHPWPIGLIRIKIIHDDPYMLGILTLHNGKRFTLFRPLDMSNMIYSPFPSIKDTDDDFRKKMFNLYDYKTSVINLTKGAI